MTVLEMTLSGGVFILAIVLFRALTLRRLPKQTFVMLWWAAALRLLLPLKLPSQLSVYSLIAFLRPKAEAPAISVDPPVAAAAPPVVTVVPPPGPSPAEVVPAPAAAPFPVWTALWIAGAALLALWFVFTYLRWRRRFRESFPVDCPGFQTWLCLWRKVQLQATDQITAPLTYGLFRPVILLPRTLDLRDEEALTCVLAHELAHIRHLDGLFKLVLAAALCLHWFNPAAWLFYVLANRDMELRCDEAAVLALGNDSRERYALALIRLAENECVPLCGFSQKNGMEERIKAIMNIKKKSLAVCAAALALALGITTAFATSAKPVEPDASRDGEFDESAYLAEISAGVDAQWREVLAPYEPFGLSWTFEDPDLDGNGLSMTWEGHEVSGIYDEKTGVWITEHTGNGTYGPGAVELYAVYEGDERTGLRLATEEEQKGFTRSRKLSSDTLKVETLADSVRYDGGHIYFTIPESEEPWSIFIQGRIMTEDGSGQSCRYLEEESEKAEWVPWMTYSFEVGDTAFDELIMDIKYGSAAYSYPLTPLLPEGKPLAQEPLPEGKADIPEDGFMVWPVDGGTISQSQETRTNPETGETVTHTGVDIAVERGTPVYAAGPGTVKEAGFNAQDGNFVRIDHGSGQETFYAHCQSLQVKTGDTVTAGQTIATAGSTGLSTGSHLHFEFLVNGTVTDPLAFCRPDAHSTVNSRFDPFSASQGEGEGPNGDYSGRPIVAIMNGTVLDAGVKEKGSLPGPYVEILYDDDYSMKFNVCQSVLVKTGDSVKAGDVIAYTGKGATAMGPSTPQDRAAKAEWEEKERQTMEEELVNGDYPRNSRGQTYGRDFSEYLGYPPDLIPAVSTDGQDGWVSYEMLNGRAEDVMTPEQMAAYQESLKMEGFHVFRYDIPVYDNDGNQIGVFEKGVEMGNYPFKTIEDAREAVANGWPDNQ